MKTTSNFIHRGNTHTHNLSHTNTHTHTARRACEEEGMWRGSRSALHRDSCFAASMAESSRYGGCMIWCRTTALPPPQRTWRRDVVGATHSPYITPRITLKHGEMKHAKRHVDGQRIPADEARTSWGWILQCVSPCVMCLWGCWIEKRVGFHFQTWLYLQHANITITEIQALLLYVCLQTSL